MDRARRRRKLYTLLAAIAAVALAVVLVVSGRDSGSNGPTLDARAAVATVEAFQRDIANRDYASICDKLFTVDARDASGGGNCQAVLAQNASRIRDPKVEIRSVVLSGNAATVSVMAQVAGGPAIGDTIRLVRDKAGYRISSAGSGPGES